jgi:predicted metal-binding membrane protein
MASSIDQEASTPLAPAPASLARLLARPRAQAILCLAALAGLGWLELGVMIGAAGHAGGSLSGTLFEALCRPSFGTPSSQASAASAAWGAAGLAVTCLMWSAMALAMMLPTASPMVLTYADIAATAVARGERVVAPPVLVAGYVTVWLAFAAAATLLQAALARLGLIDPTLAAANGLVSGAIFIGAGAYQFSSLKHACVTLCQRPFPYLLAHWSVEPRAVFRIGLAQGLYCLGCCWAMMLVMLAVGTMNVLWMAALGIAMGVEKISTTTRFSRAVGAALLAIGALFVAVSVAAH